MFHHLSKTQTGDYEKDCSRYNLSFFSCLCNLPVEPLKSTEVHPVFGGSEHKRVCTMKATEMREPAKELGPRMDDSWSFSQESCGGKGPVLMFSHKLGL